MAGLSREPTIQALIERAERLETENARLIALIADLSKGAERQPTKKAPDPLVGLDPQHSETMNEVSRLTTTIISGEDEICKSGHAMVRGLILHVLTAEQFTGIRNLVTVRQLIRHGASEIAAEIRAMGKEEIDPPHLLLWRSMELNPAFNGMVAGIGAQFCSIMVSTPKTYRQVLQNVIAQWPIL